MSVVIHIVCDVCGSVRLEQPDESERMEYERITVCNAVVGYRYSNGWVRIPLATIGAEQRGIDLCSNCPPDDQNLSALVAKVR